MIINFTNLDKDLLPLLFAFFEEQEKAGVRVWEKGVSYKLDANTEVIFEHDMFKRKRKLGHTGFRYEIISNEPAVYESKSGVTKKILSTMVFEKDVFLLKNPGKRLVKIQYHNKRHPLLAAIQEAAIGGKISYLSSKEPTGTVTSYTAMKYINALSLSQIIENGHILSTSQRHEIALKIIACLITLKNLDIIHGDIKTANVLIQLTPTIEAYVIDFGLSTDCRKYDIPAKAAGTPGYWAPEILEGEIGFHSDVFSLGRLIAVLFNVNLKTYQLSIEDYCKLILGTYTEAFLEGLFTGLDDLEPDAKSIIRTNLKSMFSSKPSLRPTLEVVYKNLNFNIGSPPEVKQPILERKDSFFNRSSSDLLSPSGQTETKKENCCCCNLM